MKKQASVIGAGLAGCEAAYQLAKRGIHVDLYEMKPQKYSDAHHSANFAELVCSNSLRSDATTNAVGVLKQEMRMIGSLIMDCADENKVPAGSALAVDREMFSKDVTDQILNNPNITVYHEEITSIPEGPCVIATGPLSSDAMVKAIGSIIEDKYCYFYDAAAPIVTRDSINMNKAYKKSRYDKGEADYINCPMTQEEFTSFYQALITAESAPVHGFEDHKVFEGCMPFEVMAKRGMNTLLFGPMKPVGLETPDGKRPYAVVQLRQDNAEASLYNIVGFQTHLKWGEQKRILQMIPGLENCEIVRYGVMHRNTYINSPAVLRESYQFKDREDLFFAGQMTGVEGYIESAASGMLAGINLAHVIKDEAVCVPGVNTMIGAMSHYISHGDPNNFQPMNANFGIMHLEGNVKKKDRKSAYMPQSEAIIQSLIENHEL